MKHLTIRLYLHPGSSAPVVKWAWSLVTPPTRDFSSSSPAPSSRSIRRLREAFDRLSRRHPVSLPSRQSRQSRLRVAFSRFPRPFSPPAPPPRLCDSFFFPDDFRANSHALSLRRKDFLQLFGDRDAAKVEPPWRALFFGSDEFSLRILKRLHGSALSLFKGDGLLEVLDVCTTRNDGPNHTQNPVLRYALQQKLKVIDYPVESPLVGYDVGLLASFGHLVPARVIQSFPYGILNVHPSLLPRWRGASPCLYSVLHGDVVVGVSIMQVAPRHFDIGPLVAQRRFLAPRPPAQASLTTERLAAWMAREGGKLLFETLDRLPKLTHRPTEQPMAGVTYAHKVRQEMGNVDWERNMRTEVARQFLALAGNVGLKSEIGGMEVSFLELEDIRGVTIDSPVDEKRPGTHYFHKLRRLLCIRCLDGWVAFSKVKIKGKKPMSATDFHNGFLSKPPFADALFLSRPNFLNEDIFHSRVRRTLACPNRDAFVSVAHGHDSLLVGRDGRRFVTVL